ncbi:uncharacterized protein LOC105685184 [Athalia rosae]|uniref:uncharacterized protein LOC105685184 n=1 Tax=Athalia rosae TaxID=37344 RepID=UPI0020343CF7|nr:uncharacterized protein LOC105685184 [Athalia rosae]
MKIFLGYCLICIFVVKVQSKPQITKLFPVKELVAFHEKTNEIKPLDKFLGKLKAAYDFVFNKPEDTSNVEKILANDRSDATQDASNPEIDALKLIWTNVISSQSVTNPKDNKESSTKETVRTLEGTNENRNVIPLNEATSVLTGDQHDASASKPEKANNLFDGVQEGSKSFGGLELQENSDDDSVVETVTPTSTLQLPQAVGKQLLEWLSALLGLTYGAYVKVAQAVKT